MENVPISSRFGKVREEDQNLADEFKAASEKISETGVYGGKGYDGWAAAGEKVKARIDAGKDPLARTPSEVENKKTPESLWKTQKDFDTLLKDANINNKGWAAVSGERNDKTRDEDKDLADSWNKGLSNTEPKTQVGGWKERFRNFFRRGKQVDTSSEQFFSNATQAKREGVKDNQEIDDIAFMRSFKGSNEYTGIVANKKKIEDIKPAFQDLDNNTAESESGTPAEQAMDAILDRIAGSNTEETKPEKIIIPVKID